jgi:hypothetical protein
MKRCVPWIDRAIARPIVGERDSRRGSSRLGQNRRYNRRRFREGAPARNKSLRVSLS